MKSISIKTKIGWVTAFEKDNKIFRIKFVKSKTQSNSTILKRFKKSLLKYFKNETNNIKILDYGKCTKIRTWKIRCWSYI